MLGKISISQNLLKFAKIVKIYNINILVICLEKYFNILFKIAKILNLILYKKLIIQIALLYMPIKLLA